jgi:hypothetical protein
MRERSGDAGDPKPELKISGVALPMLAPALGLDRESLDDFPTDMRADVRGGFHLMGPKNSNRLLDVKKSQLTTAPGNNRLTVPIKLAALALLAIITATVPR